jgi:type III secretory pathway component EscT
MITLILALRGAAAVGVLVTLVSGIPPLVGVGLAVSAGLWTALVAGPLAAAASILVPGGALPITPLTQLTDPALLLVGVRELVMGAVIGVMAALPLLVVAKAGRLVERAGELTSTPGRGPYRNLFGVLGAAVFVGIDGHVSLVSAITDSFRAAPPLAGTETRVLATLAHLVPAAVQLAIPWLVTAAVVEIAAGVAARLADRAASHGPVAAATPAALAMMTASLVGTLAVAIAALVR